ncbi:MAG: hypothetical protein DWC07_06060 [Candidatus Poseidoniales archaeon]|nr:MAG: hypothetical protein DWC07_06060 [Candidatus Poseidoniales archaeon]
MNKPNPLNDLKMSDMTCVSGHTTRPSWNARNRSMLAHGTGCLPEATSSIGWMPVGGNGSVKTTPALSSTMQALHQRCVRGEA